MSAVDRPSGFKSIPTNRVEGEPLCQIPMSSKPFFRESVGMGNPSTNLL